jgi:hypothetical protein
VSEIGLCALDEKIRTLRGEAVIEADVIWDKIKEELYPPLLKPSSEPS